MEYFLVRYASRVVIYERKTFIRWPQTGLKASFEFASPKKSEVDGGGAKYLSKFLHLYRCRSER